jgi:hypothetical protein
MPVQRAVTVSAPGDAHEREADAVASRVAAGETAGPISPVGAPAADAKRQATPEATDDQTKTPLAQRLAQREMAPMQDPASAIPRTAAPGKAGEETIQRHAAPGDDDQGGHEMAYRRAAAGAASAAAAGHAAAGAIASPGPGRAIDPATRSTLESRMGVDLGGVRVHDDAAARAAARSIDARAFAHGDDIWLGPGESADDTRLMAHEATHVAQQRGGVGDGAVGRQVVRRKNGGKAAKGKAKPPTAALNAAGAVEVAGKGTFNPGPGGGIELASIQIPKWKLKDTPATGLQVAKRGATDQVKKWEDEVKPSIDPATEAALDKSDDIRLKGERVYFFAFKKGRKGYVIGTKQQLLERARRPDWDDSGAPHYFDVDHKHEIQLGGADDIKNMWLLDSEANQTSGSNISSEINNRIGEVLEGARGVLGPKSVPSSAKAARKSRPITIKKVVGGLPTSGKEKVVWTPQQVKAGEPLKSLRLLSKKDAEDAALIGAKADGRLMIFASPTGGSSASIPWKPASKPLKATRDAKGKDKGWGFFDGFPLDRVEWTGTSGTAWGTAFKDNKFVDEVELDLPLTPHPYVPQAAVANGRRLEAKLRNLHFKPLSLVQIEIAELRDPVGLYVRGKVLPSVPLIEKAGGIDLVIQGNDVYLEKTFSAEDFAFPGPVQVTEASLALAAGTMGLRVTGHVGFEIERVGAGSLEGKATASSEGAGFSLEGQFDFDERLVDKGTIKVWYRPPKFGGSGDLEISRGKFKGITGARLSVVFDDERIEAKGAVDVAIRGVERGDLSMAYDKEKGLRIGGALQLTKDIPGIKSGTLTAALAQRPDESWALSGGISAILDIPGAAGTVTGGYDDGAFQIEGTVGYEKGLVKGSITAGATNRAVGEDGTPADGPTEKLRAYGGGTVTVRLAPWLQGTVGLRLKPDGGIEVTGEVALPSTLDLFPEKKLSRRIFAINIDIPIVGFSVAGQNVGIFASIGGGLDAEAAIGPGQLREARLGVKYDPAHEDATTVSGAARLHIGARAGLRLFVRGALGAGIPLVDARAGIELGGALGIEGALESSLAVDWSPAKGLTIDSVLAAYAQPVFKFDVTGFVEVTFDYFIGEETLYDKKWKLAAFEYGSGMRFGLKLPVRYEEGKAFDVALSDVEFEYPQIDPLELIGGLVKQLA